MKKIFAVIAALLAVTALQAKVLIDEKIADDGSHSYTTRIGLLAANKAGDELVVFNNSSRPLRNLTCTLTVKGKSSKMQVIPQLPVGAKEDFDGAFDDDLDEELYAVFGPEGKFTPANKNEVTFTLSFGEDNGAVRLNRVFQRKSSLCFEIADAGSAGTSPADSAASATSAAVAVPAAGSQSAADGAQKVVIDGQSYILLNGQAYKVQE